MSGNPLVAGPVDTATVTSGAGVVDDLVGLNDALSSGSWLAVGLSGVGTALDAAATVSDPLGSLIAAGLGWLMDHLQPLKGWLDDLTGDAGAVLGYAGTWENVAKAMGNAGDELSRVVRADLEAMSGDSIAAYGAYADKLADHIRAGGGSASSMASALRVCGQVVQAVHDVVRDTLSQLVGSAISWAAEAVFSFGLATPWIVEQVSTRVSSLAARIGTKVKEVVQSAAALRRLLDALKAVLSRVGPALRRGARDGDDVSRTAARDAAGSGPRALPDISDVPHPKDGGDLDAWAQEVARRHGDLTPDEVKAIYAYTTNKGYAEMNGLLRGTSSFGPDDAARIQRDVDDAVSGLDKLPTHAGVTYRGTNLPDSVLDDLTKGARYSDRAFASTTLDESVAQSFRGGGNTLFTIDGHSGVDVQALSHFGHEAEILVKPSTPYEVVSRVADPGGYWRIGLREVAP